MQTNPADNLRRNTKRGRVTYETRVLLLALLIGVPGTLALALIFFLGDYSNGFVFSVLLFVVLFWLGLAFKLQREVIYHLQTLSNLLEALREGDYSLRGRRARWGDALGEVVWEVNELSKTLREQRLEAREASALLQKVIAELDVAVFAFDGEHKLRLINRAGERLLAKRTTAAIGQSAVQLGLNDLLDMEGRHIAQRSFPGASGRWDIWIGGFRESGLPHYLLVISDLSRALREEERKAWQRLIRVLGHELNNSLAPIKSMATTLKNTVAHDPLPGDWRDDLHTGLGVIADRADALSRFMSAYATLAKLPAPKRKNINIQSLVKRVAAIDQRLAIDLRGEDLGIRADPDQLEQLLINLVKNAVDAVDSDAGGEVGIHWRTQYGELVLEIQDNGPGIANTENLFVPFFTTKPDGTGIGLVLCRQIAEAHGGSLNLENRKDNRGCVARLTLPL
ncbi:MAG: ATP-binding protein [Gammaproteobacteria bacterium]|nr:ATP-binding protein [Gammaproteobacteria bacterium]